ncbi:MAG: hypothetical protein PVJ39_05350 [Gammaproteobacteria bacterium]|jgi:hypothetical protein
MKLITHFLVALCCVVLPACGGGGSGSGGSGGGGSVVGVQLPDNVSVVTATDDSSAKPLAPTGVVVDTSGYAATSDYALDETRSHVYDPSMEPLDSVNMILCLMEQTRASDMVNQGAYIALVDEDKCEQGQNQSNGSQAGQTSSNVKQYNKWTVQSSRASSSDPMIVKIWVPGDNVDPSDPNANPEDAQNILVEVTATEGVSADKPFGSFSMNFKGVVDEGLFGGTPGNYQTMMLGLLETVDNAMGQPQFRFINVGGGEANSMITDFSFTEATAVVMDDASGTGGVAKTMASFSDPMGGTQSKTFAVAFNDTHLRRALDSNNDNSADVEACVDRNQFNTQVWRYNLYHAADGMFNGRAVITGDRVVLNSGFPFRYDTGNGEIDGHISYWGLWAENDAAIPDGATIQRMNFSSGTTTPYTVNVSPGKLIKRSANTELLSKYQGDKFTGWYNHPTAGDPTSKGYDSWEISVDTNNDFVITGGVTWGENGPQVTSEGPYTITLTGGENLWLWSDALGGNIVYVYDSTVTNPANRTVTFYDEEFVYPDDTLFSGGNVTVYCYDRCMIGGLTQTDVNNATSDMDLFYPSDGTEYVYTLTASNGKLTLTDNTAAGATVSTDGLDLSSLGIDWGMQTGEMVADNSAIVNPWDVYNQPVTFRWETGSNEWNKLITVSDSNGIVRFDKPLQFNYTLEAGDEANGDPSGNAGKTFLLEYGGNGELWGFPWQPEAGCDTSTEQCRWYSAVTLKNGVQLTDGDGNNFVVKQIEREQNMQEVSLSPNCDALNAANLFSDPAMTLPTTSDINSVSFSLADKPVVTDAPAVIEGELQ